LEGKLKPAGYCIVSSAGNNYKNTFYSALFIAKKSNNYMFKALNMHNFIKIFQYNASNKHNYLNYTSLITTTEELDYLSGFSK
jgi:hypothetical protein